MLYLWQKMSAIKIDKLWCTVVVASLRRMGMTTTMISNCHTDMFAIDPRLPTQSST